MDCCRDAQRPVLGSLQGASVNLTFYASDKPREHMLAQALVIGAKVHGDTLEIRRTADYGEDEDGNDRKFAGPSPDTHIACMFGVKGQSRRILDDHRAMGRSVLFFDKGYTRTRGELGHTEYSRVSVNGFSPSAYMMLAPRSSDRWKRLEGRIEERTANTGHVLICGSSPKYHLAHGLPEVDEWAARLVSHLHKITTRQIVYRPKPKSYKARPVNGAAYSHGGTTIKQALRGCHCVVTHGASAAVDAVIAGVPVITLGACAASPVAEKRLDRVDDPYWPSNIERYAWACALAYAQWTTTELRSGEAWEVLKAEVARQQVADREAAENAKAVA